MAAARVGSGKWTYEAIPDWGRGARGVPEFGIVSGLACDSRDNVYVFNRTIDPGVFVFDPTSLLSVGRVLLVPFGWRKVVRWSFTEFRYAFVHTTPPDEARAIWAA